MAKLEIDTNEEFPTLSAPPIAEAAIEFRAIPSITISSDDLLALFQTEPEYSSPIVTSQFTQEFKKGETSQLETTSFRQSWNGVRATSIDKHTVVQFTRTGMVFSQLKPYQHWIAFHQKALHFWELYKNFTKPLEIDRIGLRFINRIEIPTKTKVNKFLHIPKPTTKGLNLKIDSFINRTTYQVPNYPYRANLSIVCESIHSVNPVIILDIDVFTTDPIFQKLDPLAINDRLDEMRWLKNKLFFGIMTTTALRSFE